MQLSRLSVEKKGVLAVGFALFFTTLFLVVLLWLLESSEGELKKEIKLVQIQYATNNYQETFYSSAQTMGMYFVRKSEGDLNIYRKRREEANDSYKKLKDLIDDPQQLKLLEKLRKLQVRLFDVFDGIDFNSKEGLDTFDVLQIPGVRQEINSLLQELQGLMKTWKYRLNELEEAHSTNAVMLREFTKWFVMLMFVFSIFICITVAVFFSRNVTSRLRLVMDNALRLGTNRELLPRLSGEDEIAQLDDIFRRMARALEESRERETAMIENASDVICSIDADNKFTQISPASRRVWGYDPDELLGKRFAELLSEDDAGSMLKSLRTASDTAAGGEAVSIENIITRKDRSRADMAWSINWSPDRRSYFCVVHDITQQKQAERMKQELMQMASHDLRSPLCSIQISLNLMESGAAGELSEKSKKIVERSTSDVTRLIELIDDLLDLEKLQAGKMQLDMEVCDMSVVAARAVSAVQQLAEQRNIKLSAEDKPIEGFADASKLVQVVVNLLGNAIKFSPDNSTINVTYDEVPGFVEMRVTDQGRGIPADKIGSIFNRFEQVESADHKEKGGKGLGLAICKSIVEAHNGEIGVTSDGTSGSTFWFRIPQSD